MDSSSVNGMCRCCASEGAFKDIKTSYHWMGEEEVYGDMLRECFDVNLSSAEHGGICEVCITQLRNAANFKKQVLHTESQFKQHLRSKGFKAAQVKEEMSGFDDNDSDDMDNVDDEDYVPDYEVPIKTESESEEKPKKRAAKPATTRSKKSKSNDGEAAVKSFLCNIGNVEIKKEVETNWGLTIKKIKTEPDDLLEVRDRKRQCTEEVAKLNFRLLNEIKQPSGSKGKNETPRRRYNNRDSQKLNIQIANVKQLEKEVSECIAKKLASGPPKPKILKPKVDLKLEVKPPPDIKDEVIRSLELDKHRHNIRMIMHCSNATPIRTHYVGNGYACCFCDEFFPKAADLKSHTINKHDKKEKNKFMQKAFLFAFIVKLDITELKCNICKMEIDNLDELFTHLKEVHNKTVHTDIKSQIVCFKLNNEALKCMFCQLECSSFKILQEHMNRHYRNYICEECDAGFVTQRMLSQHADGHKLGHFECEACKKVFDRLSTFKYHERMAHSDNRYKCFQCGDKFGTIKLKRQHMIEVHAAEFTDLPCGACEKTFKDKNALRIHTQRDHLMERRFECPTCDKTFFASGMLKSHMVTHTGSRDFKCEVCGKDFARKKTLQTHMRTHKDERKLVCYICQKVFCKQSTLDTHLQLHIGKLSCDVCDERFTMMACRQTHMMSVHGRLT